MDDIKRRLDALEKSTDQLVKCVFIGNGKPSLKARADVLESEVSTIGQQIQDIKDDLKDLPESIDKKLNRQSSIIISIILAVIGIFEVIINVIK